MRTIGSDYLKRRQLLLRALVLPATVAAAFGLAQAPEPAAPVIAFVNVNVIPMTAAVVLRNQTVIVRGERIADMGPAVQIPDEAVRIEGSGSYLLPGLIDFHVHVRNEAELSAYLRHGVTTVVSMRGTRTVRVLRDRLRAGTIAGPRLLTAGPLVDGDPPIWPGEDTLRITSPEGARRAAAEHCRGDYEFLKAYNNLQPDLLEIIVAAVHECGIPVAAHLPRVPVRAEGLRRALAAGVDIIAHGEEIFFTHLGGASDAQLTKAGTPIAPTIVEEAVQLVKRADAYVVPNLSFIEMTRRMLANVDEVFADPEFQMLSTDVRRLWQEQNPTRRRDLEAFTKRERLKRDTVLALTLRLQRAGVPLLLGTDASGPGMFPGKSAHLELEQLVAAGLSPYEALTAGTSRAARFLETRVARLNGERLGLIAVGAIADLILLPGNPLEDVRHLAGLNGVMVRGSWHPRQSAPAREAGNRRERRP
jgi:imidazolonepropionase-like amidohydrolase